MLTMPYLISSQSTLQIENSTFLNIRFEIFGWICMYVCIDRIWSWMTYKGSYSIKPNQPTNQPTNQLITECCNRSSLPNDWIDGSLVSLYKGSGEKGIFDNYRGITLLDAVSSVFLESRWIGWLETSGLQTFQNRKMVLDVAGEQPIRYFSPGRCKRSVLSRVSLRGLFFVFFSIRLKFLIPLAGIHFGRRFPTNFYENIQAVSERQEKKSFNDVGWDFNR